MPKSKWVEWDAFPDPPKGRRKPRATIEVLDPEPEPTPRVHRVTVDHVYHRRSSEGICPQRIVIVVAFAVLALVLLRSPGAFILLAALIPSSFWLALAVIVAVLAIVAVNERVKGRPF